MNKKVDENKIVEAFNLFKKLQPLFGKNMRLEVNSFNQEEKIEIRIYEVTNLVQLKKVCGVPKFLKGNCNDFQYADGEVNGIKITAYTDNGVTFNPKCRIVREQYEVPAQEAHIEYRTKIVCDA